MQVGAYIWHFRMRFCFFSSGDDVGPTRGGGLAYSYGLPFCQTDILFKIRLEDVITRAKKTKCHAEVPSGRLPPAFSVILCCFFCFFSMVFHCYEMGPLLCLLLLLFSWFCIIHIHGMQLAAQMTKSGFLLILVWA